MVRTHVPSLARDIYDTARRVRMPWENNPRQNRYSRRCAHNDTRTVMVLPRDRPLLIVDLTCPCGRPVGEHRQLGGPRTNPPGCAGWRPRQAPRLTYHLRARLTPSTVTYPPFVGWLRGRPNRVARRIVDLWRPYCSLDDAPFLLARPVVPSVADTERAAR